MALQYKLPNRIIKTDYIGSNKLVLTVKNDNKIIKYIDTIENILNLHENSLNDININYKKYIINQLINCKPIKFYVDSIICDYFYERDNEMNIKYIVKLSYFKNEYVYVSFEELIERGYFKLINEWRKYSLLFSKEFIKSSGKYYHDVYYKQLDIISNIDLNPWKQKSEFIKMWFEINANGKGTLINGINCIADIGFGAAFPLYNLINTFKPRFVYALEINKARYHSFKQHTKEIFDKYKDNKNNNDLTMDPFKIENKTHFIIDNRDFVSFCRDLDKKNGGSKIKNYKNGQNLIDLTIDHKISSFCSESICDCHYNLTDLTLIYDVGEYLNNYDLDYCLKIISKWSYYLYFAVPVIEEYNLMNQHYQFNDKWAIKRTKKEYQEILFKYWRLVGNSFWESKLLVNDSMIENAVCHIDSN